MKKSYHSNAVPADEAATTVRMETGVVAPSTAASAIRVPPEFALV